MDRHVLRSLTDLDAASRLLRELGYTAEPHAVDTAAIGIGEFSRNAVLQQGRNMREGYRVLVAETRTPPRQWAGLGRRLAQNLHDRPLALIGVPGAGGAWERVYLLRPRLVRTPKGMTCRTARLEIAVGYPTGHDREVVEQLRWRDGDGAHDAIDAAFDVEAVARRFFVGLRRHFDALQRAVAALGDRNTAALAGITRAGGSQRIALRIVSQVLFCYFLQRKRLLAGDRDYLLTRWKRKDGAFYSGELEPLFYQTLAVPVVRRGAGLPGAEVPFLNGGLFECPYGDVSLDLPDELFAPDPGDGLLGYLAHWTFTVSEEAPDEVDVAVDPELLGRVFENLISDDEQSRHGVVYTPRPVVQFMCREALAAWLGRELDLDEVWTRVLVAEEGGNPLAGYREEHGTARTLDLCRALEAALERLTVLDPAVGSGAFLLGMLAELVRLRALAWEETHGRPPEPEQVRRWKLAAIERTLFGVDIEPLALELCRLRLWLSLVVELPEQGPVPALPNLEYRTVPGDSLTDFVAGTNVQDTRHGLRALSLRLGDALAEVEPLRHAFFAASDPEEKRRLSGELMRREDGVIGALLAEASKNAKPERAAHVAELRRRWASQDRVRPVFMPAFHAPDVAGQGGWDIVILNPPYLGKKEVAQKVEAGRRRDYEAHHGESNDLMILFAQRARELVRPGGVCSLIVQDSVFTSGDATALRRRLLAEDSLLTLARTKCFEGQAINGAVLVWRRQKPEADGTLRWVENYKRDPRELPATQASCPAPGGEERFGEGAEAPAAARPGTELFVAPRHHYGVVPSRPLFRPSPSALHLLDRFRALEPAEVRMPPRWDALSNTADLNRTIATLQRTGWYDRLRPGQFVPLGYCIVGGQGLATADDRYFLAAVEGTDEAAECLEQRQALLRAFERHADPRVAALLHTRLERGDSQEQALLWLWEHLAWEAAPLKGSAKWPRLLRVAPRAMVRGTGLSTEERRDGIATGPCFVPFEKGDQSAEDDTGRAIGAAWWRRNPIVIDWSRPAVRLLRERAAGKETHRRPRIQNEDLWGRGGVTWNGIARYLRPRLVPPGSIHNYDAPTINVSVVWLDTLSLLALLNADAVEFIVRTFLGPMARIYIGDIRRVPVPVLAPEQSARLSALGREAVAAVQRGDRAALRAAEQTVDGFVRDLYGVPREADLWVVR